MWDALSFWHAHGRDFISRKSFPAGTKIQIPSRFEHLQIKSKPWRYAGHWMVFVCIFFLTRKGNFTDSLPLCLFYQKALYSGANCSYRLVVRPFGKPEVHKLHRSTGYDLNKKLCVNIKFSRLIKCVPCCDGHFICCAQVGCARERLLRGSIENN